MESSYNAIANAYYINKVRVLYAIEYFKGKVLEDVDSELINTYKNMLRNVEAAYHNLTKVKAELNLPLHDFSTYHGDGFYIYRGRMYGDIAKAREYAETLISSNQGSSDKEPESNKFYELGLYLKHYGEKCKKDFIAVPDLIKITASGEIAAETKSDVQSNMANKIEEKNLADNTPKKIEETSTSNNTATNNVFSIFAKINTPTIVLG